MKYNYKGTVIFVAQGIDGKWGTFSRSKSGGLHRVKSNRMPMVDERWEAENNLICWAGWRRLKLAKEETAVVA